MTYIKGMSIAVDNGSGCGGGDGGDGAVVLAVLQWWRFGLAV